MPWIYAILTTLILVLVIGIAMLKGDRGDNGRQ